MSLLAILWIPDRAAGDDIRWTELADDKVLLLMREEWQVVQPTVLDLVLLNPK